MNRIRDWLALIIGTLYSIRLHFYNLYLYNVYGGFDGSIKQSLAIVNDAGFYRMLLSGIFIICFLLISMMYCLQNCFRNQFSGRDLYFVLAQLLLLIIVIILIQNPLIRVFLITCLLGVALISVTPD